MPVVEQLTSMRSMIIRAHLQFNDIISVVCTLVSKKLFFGTLSLSISGWPVVDRQPSNGNIVASSRALVVMMMNMDDSL